MSIWKTMIAGVAALTIAGAAHAADYPTKDITIIVPFKPGGAVDTTSRIIAEASKGYMDGVELKVENRDGGSGVVGQTYAANATPDGYTVLAMTSSVVTNPELKGASYKVSDFTPVALYTLDPEVIAVPAGSPFETIEDFIAAAKERKLNIVNSGIGTSHHMAGLAIENGSGLTFNYVNTRGFGDQLQAVLGGHVDAALWPYGEAKQHADAGSIRILAVALDDRMEALPDVPTWEEAGLGVEAWTTFRGWGVPKGTPDDAVAYLADLLQQVSEDEGYIEKMTDAGYPLAYRDAAGFKKIIDSYAALTGKIIEEQGFGKQ